MKLIEKQRQFAYNLGLLLTRGLDELRRFYPSAALRMGEGYVGDSIDQPGEQSPHRRDGGHFKRLGQDLMLDIDGQWITDSRHPAWVYLGSYWRSLDPENDTGGAADANHFGRRDGGVV